MNLEHPLLEVEAREAIVGHAELQHAQRHPLTELITLGKVGIVLGLNVRHGVGQKGVDVFLCGFVGGRERARTNAHHVEHDLGVLFEVLLLDHRAIHADTVRDERHQLVE